MKHAVWISLPLLALALGASSTAKAGESYFVLVFGSQQVPPRVKYAHSFATFVKMSDGGSAADACRLEAFTISWMPEGMDTRVFALLPERGRNADLPTTLRWAVDTEQRISMWGPYQIQPHLYCRALETYHELESGRVRYKALDFLYPCRTATNCVHALSQTADGARLRVLSPNFGETASFLIARKMSSDFVNPDCRHDWLLAPLGLAEYPIIRRDLKNPHSGVIGYRLRGM